MRGRTGIDEAKKARHQPHAIKCKGKEVEVEPGFAAVPVFPTRVAEDREGP
jgi:hypothetical protein